MKTKKPVCLSYTHDGEDAVKQLLVVYVNVGQLPPPKAGRLVEDFKSGMLPVLQKLPKDTGVVFLPTRNQETRMEVVPYLSWLGTGAGGMPGLES